MSEECTHFFGPLCIIGYLETEAMRTDCKSAYMLIFKKFVEKVLLLWLSHDQWLSVS